MAGSEEKLGSVNRNFHINDETEGIIPRAVKYLWQAMANREE